MRKFNYNEKLLAKKKNVKLNEPANDRMDEWAENERNEARGKQRKRKTEKSKISFDERIECGALALKCWWNSSKSGHSFHSLADEK